MEVLNGIRQLKRRERGRVTTLERERIHLLLIDEAGKGLDDVAAGRVKDARGAIQAIKRRRSA